jgi:hypothetical protein
MMRSIRPLWRAALNQEVGGWRWLPGWRMEFRRLSDLDEEISAMVAGGLDEPFEKRS